MFEKPTKKVFNNNRKKIFGTKINENPKIKKQNSHRWYTQVSTKKPTKKNIVLWIRFFFTFVCCFELNKTFDVFFVSFIFFLLSSFLLDFILKTSQSPSQGPRYPGGKTKAKERKREKESQVIRVDINIINNWMDEGKFLYDNKTSTTGRVYHRY